MINLYKIHETKWYTDDGYYGCSSVSLRAVESLLKSMSLQNIVMVDEDDEYGYELSITITGMHFNLVLTQCEYSAERSITCSVVEQSAHATVGKSLIIRKNYSNQIKQWVLDHKYVLELDSHISSVDSKPTETIEIPFADGLKLF